MGRGIGKGAMPQIGVALPPGGWMNVGTPGVISQLRGAASRNPAVVSMLRAVTDCQLYPGGSSLPFGGGLVWVGVGDGVPDGPGEVGRPVARCGPDGCGLPAGP